MDKNNPIDASLGLAFSLKLFEQYRKNGLLRAEGLHHVPGIRGRCVGYFQLVEGKVTACYVEDSSGERHSMMRDVLEHLDQQRGPFRWELHSVPAPPTRRPNEDFLAGVPEQRSPVPRRTADLNLDRLNGWSVTQKLMLQAVYESVDGMKDIEAIKSNIPLAPHIIEQALQILFSLRVIILITHEDDGQGPRGFFS